MQLVQLISGESKYKLAGYDVIFTKPDKIFLKYKVVGQQCALSLQVFPGSRPEQIWDKPKFSQVSVRN